MVGPYKTIPTYGVRAFLGSDPINRDVFKNNYIVRANRAKKLKRHCFVKKRERGDTYYCFLLMFLVLQTALALLDDARLHHDFLH